MSSKVTVVYRDGSKHEFRNVSSLLTLTLTKAQVIEVGYCSRSPKLTHDKCACERGVFNDHPVQGAVISGTRRCIIKKNKIAVVVVDNFCRTGCEVIDYGNPATGNPLNYKGLVDFVIADVRICRGF
jgi:hypothetical protein